MVFTLEKQEYFSFLLNEGFEKSHFESPEGDSFEREDSPTLLRGGSILGDGLGSLGDSVLGQLSGEEQPDRRLDLS